MVGSDSLTVISTYSDGEYLWMAETRKHYWFLCQWRKLWWWFELPTRKIQLPLTRMLKHEYDKNQVSAISSIRLFLLFLSAYPRHLEHECQRRGSGIRWYLSLNLLHLCEWVWCIREVTVCSFSILQAIHSSMGICSKRAPKWFQSNSRKHSWNLAFLQTNRTSKLRWRFRL